MTDLEHDARDVRRHVREVVAALAPIKDELVTDSARLTIDLGYDSLAILEVVSVLEHELELPSMDESELTGLETVDDLARIVVAARVPS